MLMWFHVITDCTVHDCTCTRTGSWMTYDLQYDLLGPNLMHANAKRAGPERKLVLDQGACKSLDNICDVYSVLSI
jgi:hypothetical protein